MDKPLNQNDPQAFLEPSQGIAGPDPSSKPNEAKESPSKPATPKESNPIIDPVKATPTQNNSIDNPNNSANMLTDTSKHFSVQDESNSQHKKTVHEGIDPVTRKFVKGNQLGKHNSPHLVKITQLRQAIFRCTTVDDMVDVWEALKKKAKAGYIAHQKLFLAYSVGEPTQRIEAVIATLSDQQVQVKIDSLFGVKESEDTVVDPDAIEIDAEPPEEKPPEQ